MPKVLQIKAEPLTADAFHPFGQVIGMATVQMKIVNDRFRDEPDLYYARFTCDALSNDGKYCNPEFDKLFEEQSRMFDVENERKLPARWSVSCSKTSPTIAAMTGNRPWATGIGCRIGPHFWARQCIITENSNRSGAKAAGACEL